jgi:hypothetical protein
MLEKLCYLQLGIQIYIRIFSTFWYHYNHNMHYKGEMFSSQGYYSIYLRGENQFPDIFKFKNETSPYFVMKA